MKNINLINKAPGISTKKQTEPAKKKRKSLYIIVSLFILSLIGIMGFWAYINFLQPLQEVSLGNLESAKPGQTRIKILKQEKGIEKPPAPEEKQEEQKKAEAIPEKKEVPAEEKIRKPEKTEIKKAEVKDNLLIFSEGKKYPYVVQVSSVKQLANARKYMNSLLAKDYQAYIGFFKIPKKGNYYRILIGRFETQKDAVNYIKLLKEKKVVPSGIASRIPYSLDAGTYPSYEKALKRDEELRKAGYAPFLFPIRSEKTEALQYKILIGAYLTKKDAQGPTLRVQKNGIKSKVIAP